MEEKTQTSFIPKSKTPSRGGGSSYNSFTITGVSIFLIVVLLSAGLFLFEKYLSAEVVKKEERLPKVDEIFNPEFFKDLIVADAKINFTKRLLDSRVAPTVIFGVVEKGTTENIFYSRFDYRSHQIEGEAKTVVVMEGSAPTFNAVAFQSDVFKKVEDISDVMVRNIRLRDGRVIFEITLTFEPGVLLYKDRI